jgi:hypothetical protein
MHSNFAYRLVSVATNEDKKDTPYANHPVKVGRSNNA